MSELVDVHGKPMLTVPGTCPRCGSREKDHQTAASFGGYVRTVCIKCGEVLKSWREQHEEAV